MATKQKMWGFDVRELDDSIRPSDDFYHYVNKKWMDKNPVPANESRWGAFTKLRFDTDQKLHGILKELDAKKTLTKGSPEQIIRDLYRSGMDMKRRNALGISPITPLLHKIRAIQSQKNLQTVLTEFHRIGITAIWGAGIDQDSKNSQRYLLHVAQDGLGLPDREYYLKNDAESKRVREAYAAYAEKLFGLMEYAKADAKKGAETLLSIETKLAKISMKKEDMRDPDKIYHKMKLSALSRLAPTIDWNKYFADLGAKPISEVIVMQPDFIAAVDKLLISVSLEDWKTYLEWHTANSFSDILSDPFIKLSFSFYGTVLSGTKTMKPLWRRVLGVVNGEVGELLGQIYVKKYFTKEAKEKMSLLVNDLFTAYEARIKSLSWMTPATKKKALQKLHSLNRKIGYPDKWKSYKGLVIKADDYVGNALRASEMEHRRAMKKLTGPIDLTEWFMFPQTVNAYFAPNLNDIVFPAAILQPPFFDKSADDAINYGCIGMVIGHEVTHGFDDEGSKFDSKGNLKSWWTAEDKKRFDAKARKVEKQFDRYTVADNLRVNGKLTLGENIADLGGLSIAYDAYQLQLARTGRKDIDGLTPEQRFFTGFAVFERENTRPEFEKMQVLTDPHSPGKFRINGPLSNFEPFYKAYGVKKGDALYRDPKDREMVW